MTTTEKLIVVALVLIPLATYVDVVQSKRETALKVELPQSCTPAERHVVAVSASPESVCSHMSDGEILCAARQQGGVR